jgi:hypothetical protein
MTVGRAAAAVGLVLIFAATWLVLDRTEHRPRWVVVEAPETAVVGQKFEVRVALEKSVEATQVSCTLHRANAERRGWGFLASSGPARPAVGGGTYSFVFDVPEREDTAFAFVLVYLSPTGEWQDGTRAVTTKLIQVRRGGAGADSRTLKRIGIYTYITAARAVAMKAAGGRPDLPRVERRPSAWVHPILAVLLLAAAICAMIAGKRHPDARPESSGERTVWLVFGTILAVSAVVEVSGLAGHLASLGRRLAQEQDIYDFRQIFQKAIMAAVAAAGFGLFLLFIKALRKPGSPRCLWWVGIGLAAYLSVSFVSVLSFHAVDAVRGMTWREVSPLDGARGAGAFVSLIAAVLALGAKNRKTRV